MRYRTKLKQQISRALGALYRYDSIKKLKNAVRPAKHLVCGKSGIYKAIDEVAYYFGHDAKNVRTVFDIGAAKGEYAAYFLKAFPNATVYCFEPIPGSFKELQRRTAEYGDRAKLYNFGFFDHNGTEVIHETAYGDSSSLLDRRIPHAVKRTIQVRQLDDFMREEGISAVDFCKIDVEGVELEVLRGGAHAFSDQIATAYIEIEPGLKGFESDDYIKVFQSMHDHGFGFRGAFDSGDYFFSRRA